MTANSPAESGQVEPTKAYKTFGPYARADQAAHFREYWGDLYGKGWLTLDPKLGKLVPLDTYMPPDDPKCGAMKVEEFLVEKKCRGCGEVMPLERFSPSRTERGRVKSRCRECCAEAARQYGSTPEGKSARARAQAKYEAQERARQATLAARACFEQSPAYRKLLE